MSVPSTVVWSTLFSTQCLGFGAKHISARALFQYKDSLSKYGFPIMKIRLSWDSLIFMMAIPILTRRHFYSEAPSPLQLTMVLSTQNVNNAENPCHAVTMKPCHQPCHVVIMKNSHRPWHFAGDTSHKLIESRFTPTHDLNGINFSHQQNSIYIHTLIFMVWIEKMFLGRQLCLRWYKE